MASRGRRGKHQCNNDGFDKWGGYMQAKKTKLEEQFTESTKKHNLQGEQLKKGIFNGVAISVNGYTDPTADDLKRLMLLHGGIYHHYYSSRTTHIIANNLPDSKVKALKGNEVIVDPSWIMDSVKAEKLLNYQPYLLFTNQRNDQPRIRFEKNQSVQDNSDSKVEQSVKDEPRFSPNTRNIDAKDEKFLGEFYNNSRLHLISTMKSDFKSYVMQLRNKNTSMTFPHREVLSTLQKAEHSSMEFHQNIKTIMHVDMDCFFVSVSIRKYPNFRGKPVGVAHAKGNKSDGTESWSEIASCSYEARKCGVKNGMFVGPAMKLCPDLQIIPYDFDGYQSVAKTLYDTISKYTLDIQAVSCDEMLVDLSSVIDSVTNLDVMCFCEKLREEIFEITKCTASIGLGPNVLLAKLATKKAKPNGIHMITGDRDIEEFMKNIHVRDLPGVGRVIAEKLKQNTSIETCVQLQEVSLQTLKQNYGVKTGQSLYDLARGRDDKTNLDFDEERKTVSAEVNYGIRFSNISEAEKFVSQLSEEVTKRLLHIAPGSKLMAKQLTLKIMIRSGNAPVETRKYMGHGLCDSFSKSANLSSPTNEANVIKRETLLLMNILLKTNAREVQDLRGIGIQLGKFEKVSKQLPNILNFMNKTVEKTSFSEDLRQSSDNAKTVQLKGHEPSADVNNLSLSQIDQETLDALPKNIREEILQDISSSSHQKPNTEINNDKTIKVEQSFASTSSMQNISFSQFDPHVLSELPIDLQNELRAQYSSKSRTLLCGFDKIMPRPLGKELPNPLKGQSNLKGRRGRPPKNSPRFRKSSKAEINIAQKNSPAKATRCLFEKSELISDKLSSVQHISDNIKIAEADQGCVLIDMPVKESEKDQLLNITSHDSSKLYDVDSIKLKNCTYDAKDSIAPVPIDSKYEMQSTSPEHKKDFLDRKECPSDESLDISLENEENLLKSKDSIAELRTMLRKWVNSFVTPSYDDVETITNYFKSQIKENNLELAHLGLKSLCRTCLSSDHPENWTGAYNGIIREVQRTMVKCFGKRLSVNFKF